MDFNSCWSLYGQFLSEIFSLYKTILLAALNIHCLPYVIYIWHMEVWTMSYHSKVKWQHMAPGFCRIHITFGNKEVHCPPHLCSALGKDFHWKKENHFFAHCTSPFPVRLTFGSSIFSPCFLRLIQKNMQKIEKSLLQSSSKYYQGSLLDAILPHIPMKREYLMIGIISDPLSQGTEVKIVYFCLLDLENWSDGRTDGN